MMRIVLVHPAGSNWVPGRKDVTTTANRMAPLGLLSIAAYLSQKGHHVIVHDCLGPDAVVGTEATGNQILSHKPDLVGFSTTTSAFPDACDLAQYIKNIDSEILIVFGGVHVSALGETLLQNHPYIDYLCMGEGEIPLANLADGMAPETIRGLVYRRNGRIITNAPVIPVADLDDLPFPAYEKLRGFPGKYNLPLFSYVLTPGATMITSRGCPYQCTYCDRSVFGKSYRFNSAAYVYTHMKYLRDRFGVRHINIYDDLFTTHRKRIAQLCDLLIRKPLGMQFNCAVRVGHVDDALLDMLKAAGFLQLSLGIETGDPDLMEIHKPGVHLDQVRDTVTRIRSRGLRVKGLFMMGLPGETVASIQRTSDLVMSLDLDDMNMAKFTPFPGAPIWKNIHQFGTLDNDWKKMNCLNFVFIPNGIESKQQLDQLYNQHVKRFYSSPQWRKKFKKRLWEHRRSLWYLVKHLPSFLSAMRTFEPNGDN